MGEACLALPGATMDHPFGPGHDAYKVGGKMFALIGAEGGLSLKVSDTAYEVLTEEGARRRPLSGASEMGASGPSGRLAG
ncbi:MmcQ/YjbR family DNA-binding protein [Brevundimonas sp. LF-1]|uniref:MmcQ/YjbR family DNA-binding protein n=1 Tax=Brevundimonas sp. LF-1 TaxID=3126100 RepID=UPI0030E3E080